MPLPVIEFRCQEYLLRLSVTLANPFYELSLEITQPAQHVELDQTQVERFQEALFRMLYLARRVVRFEYARVRRHTGANLTYRQQAFRQRYSTWRGAANGASRRPFFVFKLSLELLPKSKL